ncbi:MAG: type I methionyl aminopeptidase [Armatimonadota bacterium]
MIKIKSQEEIEKMRVAGRLVAQTLEAVVASIIPGKTRTIDLDILAEYLITEHGGTPSFKGYNGYPASICTSVNEEVVHGIPGDRILQPGDIVGLDLGAIVNGYHGDSTVTAPVGEVSDEAKNLLKVTRESLFKGIEMAKAGNRIGDIAHAIQVYAESRGYSIVRELVGHGIGSRMHEDPQVPNYGKPGHGEVLRPGMTLAIEPMVNVGDYRVKQLSDGWTYITKDRKLSAHFEHTVVITDGKPEILTLRREEGARQ